MLSDNIEVNAMSQSETKVYQNMSVRYATYLTAVILLCSQTIFCQTNNSKVLNFYGGKLEASLHMGSIMFYGLGGFSSNMAGVISSYHSNSSEGINNPSALAWLQRVSFNLDVTPHLIADISNFFDINSEIANQTRDGLKEYRTDESIIEPPMVGLSLGQSGNIGSGSVAAPYGDLVFFGSFFRPLDLEMDFLFTGFKSKILTTIPMSDKDEEIIFNSFIDGPINGRIGVSTIMAGVAHRIRDDMAVGIAIEKEKCKVLSRQRQ